MSGYDDIEETGFFIPGVFTDVTQSAGSGTVPEQFGVAWHFPAGAFEGAHADTSEDWHAERMNGRGCGWRHNCRLKF